MTQNMILILGQGRGGRSGQGRPRGGPGGASTVSQQTLAASLNLEKQKKQQNSKKWEQAH